MPPSIPEGLSDVVYPIPLICSTGDGWDYPVVQVKVGVAKTPINLAVSIHSNETWLLHSSQGVCVKENQCGVLEPDRLVLEGGKEKNWSYTGQSGLEVSGNQYRFSSFEPFADTGVKWRLENFAIGVAWREVDVQGLGKVDGVLGLGPGSTFLQELTHSAQKALSLYLGKDNGTLVIGGYLPKQGSGNFTEISTEGNGVVEWKLQSLSIKGDKVNLLSDVNATINPGLPDIVVPQSVADFLTTNENTKWTMAGDKLQFGSDGPKEGERPSFIFDLGAGVHVEMGEEAYTVAKQPAFSVGKDGEITLGRSFLRSAYLVMDNDYKTYHLAQANVGNTDISNPIAITVFKDGRVKTDNNGGDTDPNNSISDTTANGTNDSASGSKANKTGIIVGGIVAGLVFLALIFAVVLFLNRRSKRQVSEIRGHMGSPKRLSEGSEFAEPPAIVPRSISPPNFTQENTHLMEGYPGVLQQHVTGSRGSIFREEMSTAGPTPLPSAMHDHYENDDHIGGLQGPSSRRPLRRDQDLVRTESVISEADLDGRPTVERSAPSVPRLPMYRAGPGETAL